jgi:NAD(P)-dependent dehydrogenase (short-subunit alcohol dehydrogenase family)
VRTSLVTGSSGLIGSEIVELLDRRGSRVDGVDNNMRRDFFGEHGWNLRRVEQATRRFEPHDLEIRDRAGVERLVADAKRELIGHAAAQPSHDLAAQCPFDDFDARRHAPEPRRGDHICCISDLARFRVDFPDWELTRSLDSVCEELAGARSADALA